MKTTFKQEVVYQLLHWLEGNIHTPLSINDFVEKSGYSKWHLQRIFKEVTGQKLASYCRQRRLTSSAFMLRLFDKQIDSVGSEHGFSSHNVYHKTFKRHFNVTPAQYRDALHWSCKGLCPPINLTTQPVPEGRLVELDAMTLRGRVTDYAFTQDTICHFCWDKREALWRQRLAEAAAHPGALYGLSNVIKGGRVRMTAPPCSISPAFILTPGEQKPRWLRLRSKNRPICTSVLMVKRSSSLTLLS